MNLMRIGPALAVLSCLLASACQTSTGIERNEFHSVPAHLLRLQLDEKFQNEVIQPVAVDAVVNWAQQKSANPYYENLTVRGHVYEINMHLIMLPGGWTWNIQESTHDLRKNLLSVYHRFLQQNISLGRHVNVPTDFMRSFYARFESNGRECAGAMIATVPGALPNEFRDTLISYICAAGGSEGGLSDATIQRFFDAISISDIYYNGDGFSAEQIEYLKGQLTGTG